MTSGFQNAHRVDSAKVSVLCTFWNAGGTLAETLASLAAQTHRNFECILVDDRSTDNSAAIAADAAARDGRFHVLTNPSKGRVRALNFAASRSASPLLAILDADDIAAPTWLEDMSRIFASSEENFAVLGCGANVFFDGNLPILPEHGGAAAVPVCVTRQLCRRNPVMHSGAMMRRMAFDSVGGYNETLATHDDYDLWLRMAQKGWQIGQVASVLIGKRVHAGQLFSTSNKWRYLRTSLGIQARAIRALDPRPVNYVWIAARILWALVPRRTRGLWSRRIA